MVLAMSMFQFAILPAQAADITAMTDTMTRVAKSPETSNHTVDFDPTTAVNTNDGIQIEFESDFNIASVVNGDVAVTQVNGGTDITKGAAAVSGQDLQIPITTEGDTPAGAITVTISNNHITNPTTAGSYTITITTWDLGTDNAFGGAGGAADTQEDLGALAVGIVDNDQVTVTATVDPTFTFSLSNLSLTFGNFASASLRYADDTAGATSEPAAGDTTALTVSTNAASGATITIQDDGSGAAAGLYKSLAPTHLIAADTSYNVINGAAEKYGAYGFNASSLTIDEGFDNDNTSDLAISRSPQALAASTVPVSGGSVGVVFVGRTLGSTPAGSYADTITFIATGTF